MNSIDDELQQNAIKVMIRTYGQMPKQLFTSRHPEQLLQNLVTSSSSLATTSGAEKTAAATQQMLVFEITIDCDRVMSLIHNSCNDSSKPINVDITGVWP